MLAGELGTKVRLTVRHPGRRQTEDVDLVKANYLRGRRDRRVVFPTAGGARRTAGREPSERRAARAARRARRTGVRFPRQVADYTAAIKILSEQPAEARVRAPAATLSPPRRRVRQLGKMAGSRCAITPMSSPRRRQDVDLLSNRARASEALKNWDAAAADWSRAATGNPEGAKLLAEFARRLAAGGQVPLANGQFEKARALYERSLEADPENDVVATELAQLLLDQHENENPTRWTVLKPTEMKSEGGATLTELEDDSILAGGKNPPTDVYTLTFRDLPASIQVLRLEALLHESLPLVRDGVTLPR